MGKTYVRIDDRLIHGQIVTAWSVTLDIKEIIAIDDELASNPILQSIMTMGVPASYHPKIVTTAQAREILSQQAEGNRLVITRFARGLEQIRQEIRGAEHVNLGNCSKQADSIYSVPSGAGRNLSLTQADVDALQAVVEDGGTVICQLLPSDKLKTWENIKAHL